MHYICPMEKCWTIKEKLPIPVKVLSNHSIEVGPMLMTYERHESLGDNLNEEIIEMRLKQAKTHGLADLSDRMIKFPTGVHGSYYNYEDGSCNFFSPSKKDTENWLKQYEGIVERI